MLGSSAFHFAVAMRCPEACIHCMQSIINCHKVWNNPGLLQAEGAGLQSPRSTGDPMKSQQGAAPGKKPGECLCTSVHG